ncbi:MAG: 2-amino-4-hydroxy-6-hydroxymethyldihydropteridine diphosphokinase [Chloroflexi bacterium]|nr:2-amino-4-hydroxy-6-hydroxymethyldihydropteridine diphosphokinase [Chloroflexota bacterium]
MINEAYIGLGSNLGNSLANLEAAIELMRKLAVDVQPSPVYRTSPQGFRNQPPFYNAVCRINTRLTPFLLMEELLGIEAAVGRRRIFQNAPRILDLDILLYNRLVMESPPLVLPHPRMAERLFVLRPLADIAPHITHPVNGLTVSEMLRALGGQDDGMVEVAGTRAN